MSAPEPGWPLRRIVLVPLALFLVVSGTVFALSKLALAKPDAPAAAGEVELGDRYRGETVFIASCAGCHGSDGEGGSAGPRLAGTGIPLARAKAQIDSGGGAMPAGLVDGQKEADVLAYLATILEP